MKFDGVNNVVMRVMVRGCEKIVIGYMSDKEKW